MTFLRILALATLALALVSVAGVAQPEGARSAEAEPAGGVTVTGTGSVRTVPDRADFSFGAQSQGRTAREALTANSTEVRKVIDALKEAGIAASDIQTQAVSIHPRYSNDGQQILGYVVSNTVRAKVRNLGRAGLIIDAAVEAGANHVHGPAFWRADQGELYRNALKAAIADARSKAQTIATETGVSLGKATRVVEGGGAPPQTTAPETGRANVPIEPGTQEVTATVSVTYGIS
jgi:uncharacterized protein YggE